MSETAAPGQTAPVFHDTAPSGASQSLSQRLDRIIAELQAQPVTQKRLCVVITGNDMASLPVTLSCLRALELAGYRPEVSFSFSASQSGLKNACVDALRRQGSRAGFATPLHDYDVLYLPSLSVNSMSKIALGMRDNLACEAVFESLLQSREIVATLHPQCLDRRLPPLLLARLQEYAHMLESYGITIAGKKMAGADHSSARLRAAEKKRLIALRDIQALAAGESLIVQPDTLITPAARDEIGRRHLTVIHR